MTDTNYAACDVCRYRSHLCSAFDVSETLGSGTTWDSLVIGIT